MACAREYVRVKLCFTNLNIWEQRWMLINLKRIANISQLINEIASRNSLGDIRNIKLNLNDAILPLLESTEILQDNDIIDVKGPYQVHKEVCKQSAPPQMIPATANTNGENEDLESSIATKIKVKKKKAKKEKTRRTDVMHGDCGEADHASQGMCKLSGHTAGHTHDIDTDTSQSSRLIQDYNIDNEFVGTDDNSQCYNKDCSDMVAVCNDAKNNVTGTVPMSSAVERNVSEIEVLNDTEDIDVDEVCKHSDNEQDNMGTGKIYNMEAQSSSDGTQETKNKHDNSSGEKYRKHGTLSSNWSTLDKDDGNEMKILCENTSIKRKRKRIRKRKHQKFKDSPSTPLTKKPVGLSFFISHARETEPEYSKFYSSNIGNRKLVALKKNVHTENTVMNKKHIIFSDSDDNAEVCDDLEPRSSVHADVPSSERYTSHIDDEYSEHIGDGTMDVDNSDRENIAMDNDEASMQGDVEGGKHRSGENSENFVKNENVQKSNKGCEHVGYIPRIVMHNYKFVDKMDKKMSNYIECITQQNNHSRNKNLVEHDKMPILPKEKFHNQQESYSHTFKHTSFNGMSVPAEDAEEQRSVTNGLDSVDVAKGPVWSLKEADVIGAGSTTERLLSTGVKVYSRPRVIRALPPKLLRSDPPSKEGPKSAVTAATVSHTNQRSVYPNSDCQYSMLPELTDTPVVGSTVAYKVCEIQPDYTPAISDYKEGVVKEYDVTTKLVTLQMTKSTAPPATTSDTLGKFDVLLEDDNGDVLTNIQIDHTREKVVVHLDHMIDTKVIRCPTELPSCT